MQPSNTLLKGLNDEMTKVIEATPSALGSAQVVYRPTRLGVLLKDPKDPAKTAAITLRRHDILVLWNDGFAPEVVEAAAREWYPTAKKVVFDD